MPVTIGARPDSGFDDPIGLLGDCHRRIEHFLGVLDAVRARAADGGLDAELRTAMRAALTYFREAAPRHTRDEEDSLFPRMLARAGRKDRSILERIEHLEADHNRADALHRRVEELAEAWLQGGRLEPVGIEEFGKVLGELRSIYREHIRMEDEEVLPLARQMFGLEELLVIGQEMAARRQLRCAPHQQRQAG